MNQLKLNSIQVLRGLAAMLICFHHSQLITTSIEGHYLINRIAGGGGVALFFVISGFFMVYITRRITGNPWQNMYNFIVKRFIRILPLFYLAILLFLLVNHNNLHAFLKNNFIPIVKTFLFVPLFTDNAGPAFGFSFLYVSWTLNYEVIFYIIFGISLLFGKYRYLFIYAYFFSLTILLPFLYKGYVLFDFTTNYNFPLKYFNFLASPIQLSFLIGITIGLVINKIKYFSRNTLYTIGTGVAFLFVNNLFPHPLIPLNELLFCSIMFIGFLLLDYSGVNNFYPKILLHMGKISYSVYLMHPIIFFYLPGLAKHIGFTGIETSWLFLLVLICVIVLFATITNELIENRLSAYLKKKFTKKRERPPLVITASLSEKPETTILQ